MTWTDADKAWINRMNQLLDDLFGPDFCEYEYTKSKHCVLVPDQVPKVLYDHVKWEKACTVVVKEADKGASDGKSADTENPDVEKNSKERDVISVPVSFSDDTRKNNIEQTGVNSLQVGFPDVNGINSLTRAEIAALKLPQVVFIPEKDVLIASATEMDTSDPKLARQRPSETTVQHALKVLASRASDSSTAVDSGDEDENEVAVTIGKLGIYTRTSVRVFEKMCMLSSESAKVNAEKRWLSQPSAQDVSKVKEILLNERPSDEVLRHGQFVIDSSGFSMLACERYVNGFTIDVVSFKLLENSKPTGVI